MHLYSHYKIVLQYCQKHYIRLFVYVNAAINVCESNPCLNDGTCKIQSEGFTCVCNQGYKQPICTHDGKFSVMCIHFKGTIRKNKTVNNKFKCICGYFIYLIIICLLLHSRKVYNTVTLLWLRYS